MIESSEAYQSAVTANARRIRLKASIDIEDPDLVYGTAASSGAAAWAKLDELHDKDLQISSRYAAFEQNRWMLDGSFSIMSGNSWPAETAYVSNDLCGADGEFQNSQWVELRFSGVSILQACSVYFPDSAHDGVAKDFTVEVLQNGTAYHTETFTDNKADSVSLTGFTVYNPTAIRVTITAWSLPYRRARVAEIIPGVYEQWSEHDIASFELAQKGDITNLTVPYGTCTIKMDNLDRRFEPRRKDGIFQSIEERQGIEVSIGAELPDGAVEWKRCGTYYQFNGGWRTSDNDITMEWLLVDIIGLVEGRAYKRPDVLPQTLEGWIASIVSQLGSNFADKYTISQEDGQKQCRLTVEEDIDGMSCGEVLRYVCMATETWAHADPRTGNLAVSGLWSEGNKIDLDNLTRYPTISANEDVARLTINNLLSFDGTAETSPRTIEIINPFIRTQADAVKAARMILSAYGGMRIYTVGRGDPSSEIGDVDTVWLDESTATTGRRVEQTFSFSSGVLSGCTSELLQADGSLLWESRQRFTENGTFTVPAGVSQLRLIIVGHGQNAQNGARGTAHLVYHYKDGTSVEKLFDSAIIPTEEWQNIESVSYVQYREGSDGRNGAGGLVFAQTVNVNPGEQMQVHIGTNYNDPTTIGAYSSADGQWYPKGFTDIANGDSFARSGVYAPIRGSGDGGHGGERSWGVPQIFIDDISYEDRVFVRFWDGEQTDGTEGASGCVVIYWEDPA